MAAPSKAQLITDVHTLLKKRYKLGPRTERLTVLEAVIYGICHEGTTREQANQALARFKDEFFDWNEVRVSGLHEIESVLAGLPDQQHKARSVRRFLRQLFIKTYAFNLEGLAKKPLKDASKALQEYDAGRSDFVLATVIQHALGGHAIPIDAPLRRGLERLGMATAEMPVAAIRSTLEHAVPKNRGQDFSDLLEELVHDTCVDPEPFCPRCVLLTVCPTGKARQAAPHAKAKPTPKTVEKPAVKVAPAEKPRPPTTPAKTATPAKTKPTPTAKAKTTPPPAKAKAKPAATAKTKPPAAKTASNAKDKPRPRKKS